MSWNYLEIKFREGKPRAFSQAAWQKFTEFALFFSHCRQVSDAARFRHTISASSDSVEFVEPNDWDAFRVEQISSTNRVNFRLDASARPFDVVIGALVIGAYFTLGNPIRIASSEAWDSPGWLAARALYAKTQNRVLTKALFVPGLTEAHR